MSMVNKTCFKRQAGLLIGLLIVSGMAGCGPRRPAATYPVSGKVVFADGAPLATGGTILLESIAAGGQPVYNARGAIAADGTFRLSTFDEGDGAVAGKHRVLVQAKRDSDDFVKRGIIPKPIIDRRFERYETSDLQFTVEQGSNEFKVVVSRPSGNAATAPSHGLRPR